MYKNIKSNGDTSKAMCAGVTIWQGIKEGMSPDLQNAQKELYLEYGSNRIYGNKTLYLQSQIYSLIPKVPNINNYDVKFNTSNEHVVDKSGRVFNPGKADVIVQISLKVPNPGYTINTFSKIFKITVVR